MPRRKGTKIRVGPYVFRQRWVPRKLLDDQEVYALCDLEARSILLADVVDHPRTIENLMHEVMEAIDAVYGLELEHSKIQTIGAAYAQAIGHLIKKWW